MLLPTDPRPAFSTAVGIAVDAMSPVRPDQLSGPTPCSDFDVRTLMGHLLSVLRRVAAVGRGEPPFSVPQVSTDVPDDGWGAAARAAADDVLAVWTDDALLDRELTLPYGTHSGVVALATYPAQHAWLSHRREHRHGEGLAYAPAVAIRKPHLLAGKL